MPLQTATGAPNTGALNALKAPHDLDTLHVNLWGLPGTNKREVAAQLYGRLSRLGVSTALVHEYAKELGWAGELARVDDKGEIVEVDQLVISAEQFRRENLVHGRVSVAVTDAPVLAGVLYAQEDDEELLRSLLRRRTSGWRNLDVLLQHEIPESYESMGRIQSRADSLAMGPRLQSLIERERPGFVRMHADVAVQAIAEMVAQELKLDLKASKAGNQR